VIQKRWRLFAAVSAALVDRPFFLHRQRRKRDEDEYLFTAGCIRVLFAFSVARSLLMLVKREDLTPSKIAPLKSDLLLVQDNTEERSIDLKTAVVLNEAELPEFVHEKIDPRACCADHLCQRFLRYFGEQSVGWSSLP